MTLDQGIKRRSPSLKLLYVPSLVFLHTVRADAPVKAMTCWIVAGGSPSSGGSDSIGAGLYGIGRPRRRLDIDRHDRRGAAVERPGRRGASAIWLPDDRGQRDRRAPIHPKAMPVILTTPDEFDRWLEADTVGTLSLQRPLPDDAIRIVAKGEKEDLPSRVACSGER